MRLALAGLLLGAVLLACLMSPTAAQQRQLQATIEQAPPTRAQVLSSSASLPAHIATGFLDTTAFIQSASGRYLVFDRRAQAVYAIDADATTVTKIVQVGSEPGRIIRPTAFAYEPGGTFIVVDQPGFSPRVQRFADRGYLLNAFTLAEHANTQVTLDGFVGGGIASVQFTGDSIYFSLPQTGSLITEYSWNGRGVRAFGTLRATGQESDPEVHLLLNNGLPVVNPKGGFYFVFQAGTPLIRKYSASGALLFERHIEGRELDDTLKYQPRRWPRRRTEGGQEYPAVPSIVRTAAADPRGNLWVVLSSGIVYVYSPDGDKTRTLQMRGAGAVTPRSMFFATASRLLVAPGCYIFDVS